MLAANSKTARVTSNNLNSRINAPILTTKQTIRLYATKGTFMAEQTIAVIIPCYNEAVTIGKVIDDFRRELPHATIYVYDNNSSDKTSHIAEEHGAAVRFEPRQGKGNVCRQMFRDIDADCYLMVDGDDTYPAEDARKLADQILQGKADMVIGVPDRKYGEEAMACIILKEPGSVTEDEMFAYIKASLARHKVPKYIRFTDAFPMNAAGKILKYKMREDATRELGLDGAAGIDTAKTAEQIR